MKHRGTFKLEHVYDVTSGDARKESDVSRDSGTEKNGNEEDDDDILKYLETPKQKRSRYISLGIISFTSFTFNLGFSLVLTSAYPYLVEMNDNDDTGMKSFLGWVVAAQPFAQLFFSPLMGYLGNRFGSVRWLSMITITILCGGFVFYACIHALPQPRKYYLVIARFIIGAAAGTNTLCYSYVAAATTVKERTVAFSLFNLVMSSSFVAGPVIQLGFEAWCKEKVFFSPGSKLYFDYLTGPSWLAASLAFVNIFFFLPCIFNEHNIAKREGEYRATRALKEAKEGGAIDHRAPDMLGLVLCIIINASVQFNFIFLETLATPLTMDQLGYGEKKAIAVVGVAFGVAGLYNGALYGGLGFVARRVGERLVLVVGIVALILGPISMFPYGGPNPPMQSTTVTTSSTLAGTTMMANSTMAPSQPGPLLSRLGAVPYNHSIAYWGDAPTTENPGGGGCPPEQEWCEHIPAVHDYQMVVGFLLIVTGFPLGAGMVNAIFSKVLGPFPQGTWMGILAAGACLARTLCPICVSTIYASYGTWATFGFMACVMTCILVMTLTFHRRLVPYKYETVEENRY